MDAALQKICDIKHLLKSCAELLTSSSAGVLQTAQTREAEQSKVASDATELTCAPEFDPCPSDDNSALRDGSEKLAHYIVRLETSRPRENQCTVQDQNLNDDDDESRVLFLVFCQLSTIELCRISLVCRKWRQIAAHPLLWRRVCVDNVLLPPHALQMIATRCLKCDTLYLQGLMPVIAQCDEELQTYIIRIKGCLEPPLALLMSVSGPSLQRVHLVDCDLLITERSLWLLSVHCPNLLEVTYSSEAFPPTKEALWALSNGCPLIRELNLPPVNSSSDLRQLEDSCLVQIAKGWPGLLQLSVGGPSITYEALSSLAYHCSGLQSLELTECPPIDTKVVSQLCEDGRLSSLHTLTLMFTRVTPQAVVIIIENCSLLVTFDLYISSAMYSSSTDPHAVYKYLKLLENLKELDGHPSLRNVFHLHHIAY
ncbi:hypothetical protein EMCRGX_G033828 [Ephydatia muelleri]